MLNKSIAYRLKIYISISVVGVFIIFMIIFHTIVTKKTNENILNEAGRISSEVLIKVKRQLVTTSEIASNVSDQIIFYAQHEHSDLFLSALMERYPFINAIHVNIDTVVPTLNYHNYYVNRDINGIHIQKRNEKMFQCMYEEQMINLIASTRKKGWTDILKCPKNKNLVTSFYSPIWQQTGNKKEIVGEVICELTLIELNDFINSIEIGEDGYAFLLSKEGRYMTHPNSEWIYTKSVFSHPDKVYDKKKMNLKTVLEKGLSGSIITYPESRQFKKHWTYFSQVEDTQWILIISLPYNELFGSLYISILTMIAFAVIGIIIIFLTINYFANLLVEPLTLATANLRKFASMSGHQFNTLNEVKLVSESLDFLKSWYEKFQINQNKEEKKNHQQMQDLLEASEIQQSLINTSFSDFSEKDIVDLHGLYKPARVVGGDLFDCFYMDEEHLLFTMGDVSGKGIPAAFFMSISQTIIKSNATFKGASTIVRKANNELFTNNQHQFFLTLFLGILNTKTGVLDFCNAAHTPAYILKLNGEIVELSQTHGLPLGLYTNKLYSHSKITIEKGDSIVLYTDGVTELQNERKILFGQERFVENLRHLIGFEPEKLVNRLDKSLQMFKGNATQVDDITILNIKYKGKKKPDN